jgi:uncharacterized phage protein (TIGR01671 family)
MENREIKFRVWDIAENNWVHPKNVNLYTESEGNKLNFIVGGIATSGLIFQGFTGLKDKDGKDIYEGDICSWIEMEGIVKLEKKGFVRFDGGRFEVGNHNGYGGDWEDLGILLHPYWNNKEAQNTFKIIGNVYDKRKILEVKNE